MLGIVKNLFSKTDLDSSRSIKTQDSPLMKFVKKKKNASRQSSPTKHTPSEIVSPRKKKDVFSRFEQDIKMRRLRESFYENLKEHVSTYDNVTNTVTCNETKAPEQLLTDRETSK